MVDKIYNNTARLTNFLITKRFYLLVLALLVHVAINATNGIWVDDFWEHSANVREFMHRPYNVQHPFFQVISPHSYLNPYAYFVAFIGKIIGLDSINALGLFSVVNLILICLGIKLFVSTIVENKTNDISFYSLLFILFLWGKDPWTYSSFFNYQALLSVLPLPSAFVFGISLICLKINNDRYLKSNKIYIILVVILVSIAFLSHPLTTIFLFSVLIGQAISQFKKIKKLFEMSIIIVISLLISEMWPYFSIIKLLTNNGSVYHNANEILYTDILGRIWPVVLIMPFLIKEILKGENRAILVSLILMSLIYLYGYVVENYSYGRAISFIVIMIQILIAQIVVQQENKNEEKYPKITKLFQVIMLFLLMILASGSIASDIRRGMTIMNSFWKDRPITNKITYKDFTFLSSMIRHDDTVIANIDNSYLIPSFGGKVIAIPTPVAFLSDIELRRKDINKFFSCDSMEVDKSEVIYKYKPNYLLLDKSSDKCIDKLVMQINKNIKSLKFENDRFILYNLN